MPNETVNPPCTACCSWNTNVKGEFSSLEEMAVEVTDAESLSVIVADAGEGEVTAAAFTLAAATTEPVIWNISFGSRVTSFIILTLTGNDSPAVRALKVTLVVTRAISFAAAEVGPPGNEVPIFKVTPPWTGLVIDAVNATLPTASENGLDAGGVRVIVVVSSLVIVPVAVSMMVNLEVGMPAMVIDTIRRVKVSTFSTRISLVTGISNVDDCVLEIKRGVGAV